MCQSNIFSKIEQKVYIFPLDKVSFGSSKSYQMETFSTLLALCEAGDLRRHRVHYDIIVMGLIFVIVVLYAISSNTEQYYNRNWSYTCVFT